MENWPDDYFLTVNFAPWPKEGEVHDLLVEGELPTEIAVQDLSTVGSLRTAFVTGSARFVGSTHIHVEADETWPISWHGQSDDAKAEGRSR